MPVTVADLDNLIKQISDKRQAIEDQDAITAQLNKELFSLKETAVSHLKELGRDDYKCPFGAIVLKNRWSVNLPKSEEDRAALFSWMKEKGIYDAYVTVNSNSLKSLFLKEREIALESGDAVGFSLPGCGEAKLFEDLSFNKSR